MEVFIYFCKLMYVIEIRLNMAIASMHVHVLPSIMSTLNLKYFYDFFWKILVFPRLVR